MKTTVQQSPLFHDFAFHTLLLGGCPEADDPPSDIPSQVPAANAMSQCLRHFPHFISPRGHFIISHYHKKGEHSTVRYSECEKELVL